MSADHCSEMFVSECHAVFKISKVLKGMSCAKSCVYGICHKYAKFSKVLVLEQYAYYNILNLQMNFQIAQAQGIVLSIAIADSLQTSDKLNTYGV